MIVKIGFSTTNRIYSRIIRWFTKSNVSHCYIRLYDEFFDSEVVIHADMVGVILILSSKFDQENITVEEYEVHDRLFLKRSIKNNLRHLGKKYDWWNLFNWIWVIIFKRWIKRKIMNPMEDPKKLICVDFVLRVLNEAEITSLPYNLFNPTSFRDWCRENYKKLGWEKTTEDKSKTILDNVKNILLDENISDEKIKNDNWDETA